MAVLEKVRDRVLMEFRLWKEGCDLPESDLAMREEPLRGLVHGLPGTGKSKIILFIRRLFTESGGLCHGGRDSTHGWLP